MPMDPRSWHIVCGENCNGQSHAMNGPGVTGQRKGVFVMDRCVEEKEECSDGAGSSERCKYWARDVLPSLTGVITLPYSPSPPGERLCFNLVASGCISSPLHRLCPYFHPSIHPDCTSNGSSSQQPPAVMELCLNEQLQCPSTAPLFFSVCLSLFFCTSW